MAGLLPPPSYARCPGLNLRYFRRPRPPNRYTHPFSSVPACPSYLYSDMTWSSYNCGYIYMYYAYKLLPIFFLRKRLGFLPNTCSATSDVTNVMTATLSATEEGSHVMSVLQVQCPQSLCPLLACCATCQWLGSDHAQAISSGSNSPLHHLKNCKWNQPCNF